MLLLVALFFFFQAKAGETPRIGPTANLDARFVLDLHDKKSTMCSRSTRPTPSL
jgi:hypothetical protein